MGIYWLFINSRMDGGFLHGSAGKESTWNTGDTGDAGFIPGSGRIPGGGNGNPLQYSYLKNPKDWGAWWATVHGVTEFDIAKLLSTAQHRMVKCVRI